MVRWLTKGGRAVRVVLESTGTYSLDVALALQRARRIAVMVANPRAIKQFTGALMQRSKTDLTAAVALRDFVIRMPFVAWEPPAAHVLELRAIARRIAALVVERTRERNRLHALGATAEQSRLVRNDIEVNIRHLERRIELLVAQAAARIGEHADLRSAHDRFVSVPGIATHTAVQLLPELLVLPPRHDGAAVGRACRSRSPRSSVGHVGRQARPHLEGGQRPHPARALHAGARGRAAQCHVRAFFDKLVARGKSPLQAYVAVMRKLLHAIYGMFATRTSFAPAKFHAAA